jgi:hypothetical protein
MRAWPMRLVTHNKSTRLLLADHKYFVIFIGAFNSASSSNPAAHPSPAPSHLGKIVNGVWFTDSFLRALCFVFCFTFGCSLTSSASSLRYDLPCQKKRQKLISVSLGLYGQQQLGC